MIASQHVRHREDFVCSPASDLGIEQILYVPRLATRHKANFT